MKRFMQCVLGLWIALLLMCQPLPAKEEPMAGQIWTDPATGIEFVWIPAGKFMMGQTESEKQWLIATAGEMRYKASFLKELPRHEVRITQGFWLSKYEVTQGQWVAVMDGQNPAFFTEAKVGQDWRNHPVEQVSWDEIQAFLKKLNVNAEKEMYRLPSEAEWEYAARAGTETLFAFGDDADTLKEYAWYDENSGGTTHPVGTLKPNAWGVHDMHGNVWEWVSDWFDAAYYAQSPKENSQGPASGSYRVIRGGGWGNDAGACRAARRNQNAPGGRDVLFGFRLLKTLE